MGVPCIARYSDEPAYADVSYGADGIVLVPYTSGRGAGGVGIFVVGDPGDEQLGAKVGEKEDDDGAPELGPVGSLLLLVAVPEQGAAEGGGLDAREEGRY